MFFIWGSLADAYSYLERWEAVHTVGGRAPQSDRPRADKIHYKQYLLGSPLYQ